jgi:hypothetical protein
MGSTIDTSFVLFTRPEHVPQHALLTRLCFFARQSLRAREASPVLRHSPSVPTRHSLLGRPINIRTLPQSSDSSHSHPSKSPPPFRNHLLIFFLFSFLPSLQIAPKRNSPSIPKRSKRGSEGSPHPRLRLHLARSDPSAGGPAQPIGANAAGTEPALLIAVSHTRSDSLDRCVSPQLLRLFSGRFDGARVNLCSAWSGARDFAWSVCISRPISDFSARWRQQSRGEKVVVHELSVVFDWCLVRSGSGPSFVMSDVGSAWDERESSVPLNLGLDCGLTALIDHFVVLAKSGFATFVSEHILVVLSWIFALFA